MPSSEPYQTYYVPEQSPWPFVGSIALILFALGAVGLFQKLFFGWWFFIGGTLLLVFMLYHWFSNIITENAKGLYSAQMETSFRWGMGIACTTMVCFVGFVTT